MTQLQIRMNALNPLQKMKLMILSRKVCDTGITLSKAAKANNQSPKEILNEATKAGIELGEIEKEQKYISQAILLCADTELKRQNKEVIDPNGFADELMEILIKYIEKEES